MTAAIVLAYVFTGAPATGSTLEPNRSLEALPNTENRREALYRAGLALGPWTIDLAGVPIDGPRLCELARTSPTEPITRVVTEALGRPVDLEDLLFFIDDLLRDRRRLEHAKRPITLTPFRARTAGIFVHGDDVFEGRPRRYGEHGTLTLDPLPPPKIETPAKDGSPLGPGWTARFEQPASEAERLAALEAKNPDFANRVRLLINQLRKSGATVEVESTVRSAERGFLIYGAYLLSRAKTGRDLDRAIGRLERDARNWGLSVPIRWRHPKGTTATIREAKRMAEAFNVVYASRRGARRSHHYDGRAVDISAFNLPRELTLIAPDGQRQHFDLSAPEESRDLSLTPVLVEWVEMHFEFEKLRSDYPHWNDQKREDVVAEVE